MSDLIDLPGFMPDADLRDLVHHPAGCVVIPSLYEPFGIVALEALAAGAPLIVARTGGLAELVVGTHAGVTFEPGNPDDLAEAIEQVLTNDELATILVANARDLVERKYAWGRHRSRNCRGVRNRPDHGSMNARVRRIGPC